MLMFHLAISCLTTSKLPWFTDPTFQVPMQHYSIPYRIWLSTPDTSQTECHFCLGPATSLFLELLVITLSSYPVAYWTLSNLSWGPHLPASYIFTFPNCPWSSSGKNTRVGFHFLLQWTTFHQNSSLWPIHLGWPCMAWLIASILCQEGL